jgi:hypothetical protein
MIVPELIVLVACIAFLLGIIWLLASPSSTGRRPKTQKVHQLRRHYRPVDWR